MQLCFMVSCVRVSYFSKSWISEYIILILFRWFRIFKLNVGGLSYFDEQPDELNADGFAGTFDLNTAFETYKSVY